jgi:phage virion morphogenesis protein
MAGVAYTLQAPELGPVIDLLARDLARRPAAAADLMEAGGSVLEGSTRRRIGEEKTAPDGDRWAGWSEAYGETRHPGQTLLVSRGHLLDSIQAIATAREAQVGSNLVYAAIHQFGGADVGKPGLPARPYLGVSDADRAELIELAEDFLAGGLA